MKVIAKDDMGYNEYPYTNWLKGEEYECTLFENEDRIDVVDEQGVIFHFTKTAKANLNQVFVFVS